jgi:hypothetical protein
MERGNFVPPGILSSIEEEIALPVKAPVRNDAVFLWSILPLLVL